MRDRFVALLVALLATGCFITRPGTNLRGELDGGARDAGATPRDAAPPDAGLDASLDAARDASLDAGRDTGVSDAGSGDLLIEAEAYDLAASSDGTHEWVREASHPGFSGGGYVIAVPTSPSTRCETGSLMTCGASVRYDITIAAPGAHTLWLSTSARNAGSNSLHWAFDSEPAAELSVGVGPAWRWELAGAPALGAGGHTLTIYMRENGLRLDRIFLTSRGSTPPL